MATDIQQIDDHVERANARLATQYSSADRLKALIACFTVQVQQIEEALFGVMLGYRLSTPPVGAQLDVLGRLVGQDRESADDTEYRLRIAARVRANYSTGSAEDIYTVFSILLPGHDLKITPHYPAGFVLDIYGETDPELTPLFSRFKQDVKAGGVEAKGILTIYPDAETFTLDDASSPSADPDLGFGDSTDALVGGHLAGAF